MTDCNVRNRTIFCDDNIDVLLGINSECVDLIYLDPPFNKNKKFTAPIGSSAEGAGFRDIFREEDVKDEWLVTIREDQPELYHYLNGIRGVGNSYNFAYLAYMAIRLLECHRVLKPTGSIYLHCDPTMSHYLKGLMDCVFGEKKFRNEIIWERTTGRKAGLQFGRAHDVILFYARPNAHWNPPTIPQTERTAKGHDLMHDDFGLYRLSDLSGAGSGPPRTFDGQEIAPPRGRHWMFDQDGIDRLFQSGRIAYSRKGRPRLKTYLKDTPGVSVRDIWTDVAPINAAAAERTGYPTQKPIALLRRILQASSNDGDVILDPFCGCATTCVAAEQLNRQWIGIDVSFKAYELVRMRLTKEAADPDDLLKYRNEIHLRTDPPQRTDLGTDYRERKFVYVISHPSYPGEYKVGIAKDWKSRLNTYQTSDPDRQYRIEFRLETPRFRETERHIHETFPNKHEWVHGDLKQIVAEVRAFQEYTAAT